MTSAREPGDAPAAARLNGPPPVTSLVRACVVVILSPAPWRRRQSRAGASSSSSSQSLQSSSRPRREARPLSVRTHARVTSGGSWRTCWRWPHSSDARQCPSSSRSKPTIRCFIYSPESNRAESGHEKRLNHETTRSRPHEASRLWFVPFRVGSWLMLFHLSCCDQLRLSRSSATLAQVAGARVAARAGPPPADDCERDEPAEAGCDDERQKLSVTTGERRLDRRGQNPELRDVNHHEHDESRLLDRRAPAPLVQFDADRGRALDDGEELAERQAV